MGKKQLHTWFCIIAGFCLCCLILSCAKIGTPQGGPRDERPPSILRESSTANYQTNFEKQDIVFEFDEWIKIVNPLKEVVVSPPTDYPIRFAVKGKKGIFEFADEEVLKEDVTYQINFGNAIQDFTEGNVLKNHIFVFSTGDKLDSLSLSGKIVDALDGSTKEDVLVMLYDNLSDTAFFTQKPLYFARTESDGSFKLQNLKNDTFQLYALTDNNVNYYYDQSSEYVGFLDTLIIMNDSVNSEFKIEIFDELDSNRIIEYTQTEKGLIKVLYNKLPSDISIAHSQDIDSYYREEGDTLKIWHTDINSDSSEFYIRYDNRTDTIQNKRSRKNISDSALSIDRRQSKNLNAYRGDSVSILFNHYLLPEQDSIIAIVSDTTINYAISNYTTDGQFLHLDMDTIPTGKNYNLTILPNGIRDIYGSTYKDTIKYNVTIKDQSELGNISLSVKTNGSIAYHIILLKKEKILAEQTVQSDTTLLYKRMESGTYRLKVIEEIVADMQWTPGNVKKKRQSERIKEVPLDELRPGWDLELDVDINQIFDGTEGQ